MPFLARLAADADNAGWKKRARNAREDWPSATRDDIRFHDGPKTQFRYRERGEGAPIVFVADPPVTLELYDELIDVYAGRFRVVVVEAPTMGFSIAKDGADFSFRGVTDAFIEFLDAVVGAPATLAFSCAAGLSAVDIAARRPDLAARLVLIQTPSWAAEVVWKKSRDPKKILATPFIGHLAMRGLKKSRAPLWFGLALNEKADKEAFCGCAKETLRHGAGWSLATAFQLYLTDAGPGLVPVKQPILAVWGKADRSHADTDPRTAKEHGADIRFIIYDDLGHFPELEDVKRVYMAIRAFVDADAGARRQSLR